MPVGKSESLALRTVSPHTTYLALNNRHMWAAHANTQYFSFAFFVTWFFVIAPMLHVLSEASRIVRLVTSARTAIFCAPVLSRGFRKLVAFVCFRVFFLLFCLVFHFVCCLTIPPIFSFLQPTASAVQPTADGRSWQTRFWPWISGTRRVCLFF